MVARGYTSAFAVAEELGVDLTAAQLDQCAELIEAAETEIDQETGRSWLTTSPVTGELHPVAGPVVYLKYRPVLTITGVSIRPIGVGSPYTTLTAGSGYDLIDGPNGILLLSGYGYVSDVVVNTETWGYAGYLLSVSYTHGMVANPAIGKIATEIVAHWMRARMSSAGGADTAGIKSYALPDLTVTYKDDATSSTGATIPADLLRRLRAFEQVVIS